MKPFREIQTAFAEASRLELVNGLEPPTVDLF